ncbi:MAG: type IV secretion system DNA-binding domain-containing protein [Chloroflexi bacterium]|nr:type IV secretion system DNA-binding domain-containing protein [Chloroflexota bacterium]
MDDRQEKVEPTALSFLRLRPSADDEYTWALAEQLLVALSPRQPLAFEVIGRHAGVALQVAGASEDIGAALRQTCAHYSLAEVSEDTDLLSNAANRIRYARGYCLRDSHLFTIKITQPVEPYSALLGALDGLAEDEIACLQILFVPVRHDWATNILNLSRDPWDPTKSPFIDLPQLPKVAEQKVAKPLFAVTLRLAASSRDLVDRLETSFLSQYGSQENGFLHVDRNYPLESILGRLTNNRGMVLNAAELAVLAHIPSPKAVPDNLEVAVTSASPPELATEDTLVNLGTNRHRGVEQQVGIPGRWLTRHVATFGATGYGKTTLLKRFLSIVEKGYGLAFLDPAGDAASEFLDLIPEGRVKDVVYFNPGDRQFPPSLNVLKSSHREAEMLVAELMVALKRIFQGHAEFGPRMEWIARQGLNTLVASEGEKTLRDLPRLLADEAYREEVLKTVKDPDLQWFWRSRAPFNASVIDPILNRLSAFLDRPSIRNIVSQSNLIDFDEILQQGKIFICNLAKGVLGEEHAALLGSFILSKLQLATMARAELPPSERRLFVIVVDEFQNYASPSSDSASIQSFLSEARKFGVALVTATQFTSQLDRDVTTAIFGNVGTLICLRSGVVDAQVLQRELGVFTADDLLNLETGQALVRMGRASSAFNVVIAPPVSPKQSFKDQIIQLSRERYCRPRLQVEQAIQQPPQPKRDSEQVAQSSLEPDEAAFLGRAAAQPEEAVTALSRALGFGSFRAARVRDALEKRGLVVEVDTRLGEKGKRAKYVVPTMKGYQALGQKPPRGRGGPVHRYFMEVIARWGRDKGYQADTEHHLDGGAWVDVHLERDGKTIAVEVAITSTPERELNGAETRLAAGYSRVVVFFLDDDVFESCRGLLEKRFPEQERTKVTLGKLSEFHKVI